MPWSPLGGGILGGALRKAAEGRRGMPSMAKKIEAHRPQIEAYEKLCSEIGVGPAKVALAWLLANPVVTAPTIGPRTVQQLRRVLGCLTVNLGEDVLRRLDQIWPGPGGEAPMAYAW